MKVTTGQLLFSAKLFIASMLAYAVAVRIGLTQPYWAIATCCVCMNPLSGAIRSKGVFRLSGTLLAGCVSLAIASAFGSTPALLIVVAGIVATVAFGISFLDRTPRSYGMQLFAITLMLVAVAGVDHPENMFNTAVARVTEIGLGIVATTMVDGVLWPRSLMATLPSSLGRWLQSMERWAEDVFDAQARDANAGHDRLKLLADIASMKQLTASLRYDPITHRRDMQYAFAIQGRLLEMIPILSALTGRIAALDTAGRLALQPYLSEARACLAAGSTFPADSAQRVRQLATDASPPQPWHELVHISVADMLPQLLVLWSEIKHIDVALRSKRKVDRQYARRVGRAAAAPLPPDVGHALRLAAGIGVSYALLCTLWAVTGWQQGPNAVVLGTVAMGFFGGGDEPGQAISRFGLFAGLSFVLAFVLSYWMLPLAEDYTTFALVMAGVMLPMGLWAAVNPMATLLLTLAVSNLNLQASYNPLDFGAFLESAIATLIGIHIAFLGASLFRRWGAVHQIARFLRLESEDVARISRSATPRLRQKYTHRALDRIAVMTARLAATGQTDRSPQLLKRVGVGIHAANLRMVAHLLAPPARTATERVLGAIRSEPAAPELLASIDAALDDLWSTDTAAAAGPGLAGAQQALVGLRIALFGQAPAWVPA